MAHRLIEADLADRQINPDNRRETAHRHTDEGRRIVEYVAARRRTEISEVLERLAHEVRASLVRALTTFSEGDDEPLAPVTDSPEPPPLALGGDGCAARRPSPKPAPARRGSSRALAAVSAHRRRTRPCSHGWRPCLN
ncbi:hypothetical protein [Streptomyces sp. NPDC058595]|uniref:hypothetical protein n=1 Tax=Streptomyces sp. NPDC058595 TaxID=3346550 RepID=UPI0036547DCA